MDSQTKPSFLSLLNPVGQLRMLHSNRHLLWQFTVRNVELRHKGSILGFVWAVLNPLLMLALYLFVFGLVLGGRYGVVPDETRWDYGLGLFLGLSLFNVVAESLALSPGLIVSNPNFVKKVVFPLEILPAATVGAAVFHMAISMVMVVIGVLLGGHGFSGGTLILPVIVVPIVLFALGASWMMAALGVFFRDLGQLAGALVTALMFASAVFYPASKVQIHPAIWAVLRFNPIIHAVEMARDLVLWQRPIDLTTLGVLNVCGLAFAGFGLACFSRLKPAFADVV